MHAGAIAAVAPAQAKIRDLVGSDLCQAIQAIERDDFVNPSHINGM